MTQTMLAGRLDVVTKEFQVKEIPVPTPSPSEVRIKVEAAGVCLSDVHLISGQVSPPRITEGEITLGHEVAGTVEKLGSDVEGWRIGERVTVQALIEKADGVHTLGVDYDGGWAEYLVTPASTLVRIGDDLSFDEASIIPDAVSTPWAAIDATARVRAGEAVGVWGVGGLGAHAVQLLRMVGAAPIIAIDPLPAARERALELGADTVLDPTADDFADALLAANAGVGLDAAFDFAGFPSVQEQALSSLAPNGRLVLAGISGQPFTVTDSVSLILYQRKILGHYGSQPHHVPQLVRLADLGRLNFSASISDVLPLSQATEAVERLENKTGNPIRLILHP